MHLSQVYGAGARHTACRSSTPRRPRPTGTARRVSRTTTASQGSAHLHPLNPYGDSKHSFDLWVTEQVAENEAAPRAGRSVKFFNVYGPNEFHKGPQAESRATGPHQSGEGRGLSFVPLAQPGFMPTAGSCAISFLSKTAAT